MGAGRTVVVGDVHGCYDELLALLDAAGFSSEDRLVCVGDLIVKGDKNREVLDLFMSDARFSSVLGNHDRAVLRSLKGEPVRLKPHQEECRAELEQGRKQYAAYLDSLPLWIDLGEHLVVHAGLRPGVPLAEQTVEDLTELRTLGPDRTSREGVPWYEVYDGEKIVLFGHWPAAVRRGGPRAIGLDTGCVYGYWLTGYVVETGEFVGVPARRSYDSPQRQYAPASAPKAASAKPRTPPEAASAKPHRPPKDVKKSRAKEPVKKSRAKEPAPPAPAAPGEHPLKVFLCHSSEDKDRIRDLYRRLRADGFRPWLDEEDLLPGQEWEREITKAVESSDVVLVCCSSTSVNKMGYVQKEIKKVLDVSDYQPEGTIYVIPVKLEECSIPERLERWHWVALFKEEGYEKLRRSLRERAGSPARG